MLAAEDSCQPSSFPCAKWQKSIVTRLTAAWCGASNPQCDTAEGERQSSVEQVKEHLQSRKQEGKQQAQSSCCVNKTHQIALFRSDTTNGPVLASTLQLSQSAVTCKQGNNILLQQERKTRQSRSWEFNSFGVFFKLHVDIIKNWLSERFCTVNLAAI